MYGVVLWRDPTADRMLIWCEDQGNLAFCHARDNNSQDLKSGDLVRFDTVEERDVRIARNLSIVAADEYPSLATSLLQAGQTASPTRARDDTKIVPFPSHNRPATAPARALHESRRG